VSDTLRIVNGVVHDPMNGVDGEERDVCIRDGRIVEDLPDGAPELDAQGAYVLPGGVDIHCHIAGPKVSHARALQPERSRGRELEAPLWADGSRGRSGTGGTVPSSHVTGYRYAGLGYTTAMEAALPPSGARSTHQELRDIPTLDRGMYVLAANHRFFLEALADGEREVARAFLGWLVRRTGAFTLKAVNPGGVEAWKQHRGNVTDVNEAVDGFGVTPLEILREMAAAADEMGLPHPVHIHATNLGVAGNVQTTLETMRALEGRRAHFAHAQFHAYGDDGEGRPVSAARRLVEHVNEHPEISLDVGQVMFGEATTMTADGPVGHLLHRLSGERWYNLDTELETGCGIVPYRYRPERYVHALQWAVGLEMFLLADDPWRVVLSTDHPNGGSFLSYPRLIRLLMDSTFRRERLEQVHPDVVEGTALADGLDREYTLNEIVVVTRAGPARLLGLEDRKGHLGPGADADISVYDRGDDWEATFRSPRWVFKSGQEVLREGEPVRATAGRTLTASPRYDRGADGRFEAFLRDRLAVRPESWGLTDEELRAAGDVDAVDGAGGGAG
jgi:formylmethanofuran dehydrogenase subunit A